MIKMTLFQVTKNSVFDDPASHVKASIRDSQMLPSLAIIDPLLTLSLPSSLTSHTGLDALTQVKVSVSLLLSLISCISMQTTTLILITISDFIVNIINIIAIIIIIIASEY